MGDPETMEELSGQWVIVSEERVLAHDPDLVVILRKAEECEDEDIGVRKVLSGQACLY